MSSLKLSRRLRFNIQPPTRKRICRWNHQFGQIGCLCKGKSSGRPRVSEENVRRIQESFERSPRKSTRRASRKLGIPQPTVWRVLRRRLLFKPTTGTGSLSPSFFNHSLLLISCCVDGSYTLIFSIIKRMGMPSMKKTL